MYLTPSSRNERTTISAPDKSSTLFTSKTPENRPTEGRPKIGLLPAEHERRWSPTTSATTEQVLGKALGVAGFSHPARGNALRVLRGSARVAPFSTELRDACGGPHNSRKPRLFGLVNTKSSCTSQFLALPACDMAQDEDSSVLVIVTGMFCCR